MLASPLVHERAARAVEHRPWAVPGRSWVMAQSWLDLLFAHWPVAPGALRRALPGELELDTFEGSGWIGVTPFEVRNLRLRPTLPVPILSRFPEVNVRTYVTFGGRPGIFFFSLDAASSAAVAAARRLYRLPYFRARMSIERDDGVRFRSERRIGEHAPPAAFHASYRGVGGASAAVPGTIEHWLAERYCLYTLDGSGRVLRAEINHPPWPLQAAAADIAVNTMAEEVDVELDGDPLLHYAARQDVVFWSVEPAGASR
jgi:uncharacterized protein